MKELLAALGIMTTLSWLGSGALVQSRKPANMILILAADQGWNFTSVRMDPGNQLSRSHYHETLNLERLAGTGGQEHWERWGEKQMAPGGKSRPHEAHEDSPRRFAACSVRGWTFLDLLGLQLGAWVQLGVCAEQVQ